MRGSRHQFPVDSLVHWRVRGRGREYAWTAALFGDAAQEAVRFAPFPFRRAARATVAARLGGDHLRVRRRGAAVDHALGGDGSADALGDDALDHDYALQTAYANADLIAGFDLVGGLHRHAVDTHVPGAAGGRGRRSGLEKPYGPDPRINAGLGRLTR